MIVSRFLIISRILVISRLLIVSGLIRSLRCCQSGKGLHAGAIGTAKLILHNGIPCEAGLCRQIAPGQVCCSIFIDLRGSQHLSSVEPCRELAGLNGLLCGVKGDIQFQNIRIDVLCHALRRCSAVRFECICCYIRRILNAKLRHSFVIIVVEVVQRRGVGVDINLAACQVEVQHLDVTAAALETRLIVRADLVDRAIVYTVIIIIKHSRLIGCAMIVAVQHCEYIRILRYHLLLHQLAVVIQQIVLRGVSHAGIGVEAQDRFAVAVLLQYLIHPVDLILVDIPAHIDDDQILTILRQQVVVTQVVLVGAAIGRLILHTILAEILMIILILKGGCRYIMVAAQHTVRHACVIQDLHGLVSILPLVDHIKVVHDITGVNDIADVHRISIVHDPVVHVQVVLEELLGIVLRIGLPCKSEVIFCRNTVTVPAVFHKGSGILSAQIRQCRTRRTLYHHLYTAFLHIGSSGKVRLDGAGIIGLSDLIPASALAVQSKHPAGMRRIRIGSRAVPAQHQLIVLTGFSYWYSISNVGKSRLRGLSSDLIRRNGFQLTEFRLRTLLVSIYCDCQRGTARGNIIGSCIYHCDCIVADMEGDSFRCLISRCVLRIDGQGMVAFAQCYGIGLYAVVDTLTVQRDDGFSQRILLRDLRRQADLAGENRAVLHAHLHFGSLVVYDELYGLLIASALHREGMSAGRKLCRIHDCAHCGRVGCRNGEAGIQIGAHACGIAHGVNGIRRCAQVCLCCGIYRHTGVRIGITLRANTVRQVALSVDQLQLKTADFEVLAVGVRQKEVIHTGAVGSCPETQCNLIAVRGCIVSKVLVIDMHCEAVQAVVLPFYQRSNAYSRRVIRQVVICQNQCVAEIAVPSFRGEGIVSAVLQHLRNRIVLTVNLNRSVCIVAAVVRCDRYGTANFRSIRNVRSHTVHFVQLVNFYLVDLRGIAVILIIRADIELHIAVVEDLIRRNIHLIQTRHAASGLAAALPAARAVEAVEGRDLRAGQAAGHFVIEANSQLLALHDKCRHFTALANRQLHFAPVILREMESIAATGCG